MPTPFDVLVVGELNPDLILSGDVTPEFNQVEKLVDSATLAIGSSSAIFACGAARLGLKVAFIGKVGQDEFGAYMLRSLRERGIDVSGVVIDPHIQTGLSVILSRGADRAILTFPGAIPHLSFAEIDQDLIPLARHLHLGSYFLLTDLQPDVPRLFTLAHQHGLTTSLDTNYDPGEKWDTGMGSVLQHTEIFLPNETECMKIARLDRLDEAAAWLAKRVSTVAVKLGARGAFLQQGEQTFTSPAIPVKVVDTVGAGDSFDAGFIYGFLAGWQPAKILRLGIVCGALSTTAAGGTAAQPTLEEALAYL